jgi:hypothetical protein
MEMGAFSFAAQELGYTNGASLSYLIYVLIFLMAYHFLPFNLKLPIASQLKANYLTMALITFTISIVFLIIILVPFGGYKVFLGLVDKGTFRVSLGFFGSVAYLMTKLFLPSLLAINGFYFLKSNKTRIEKLLLVSNFILAFIFGASWGFKSTAFFILMPTLIVLFPSIKFKKVLFLGICILSSFVLFSVFFDKANNIDFNNIDLFANDSGGNPIQFVLYRLTVLQGDVCWKVWDLHINNQLQNVDYFKTVLGIFGDGNLKRIFDVDIANYPNYIKYHFGLLLTLICGNSPSAISEGYNVTGTVFSEGIIAGGKTGLVLFAVFAGFFTKIIKTFIEKGINNNLPILTAMASTYFCFNIFSWINGGGIETLFHISVILGLFINLFFLTTIISISKKLKL